MAESCSFVYELCLLLMAKVGLIQLLPVDREACLMKLPHIFV